MIYTKDGYVIGVALGDKRDDAQTLAVYANKPKAESGYDYRLRADTLEWELVPTPPAPDPDDEEISAEEALSIITGGAIDEA